MERNKRMAICRALELSANEMPGTKNPDGNITQDQLIYLARQYAACLKPTKQEVKEVLNMKLCDIFI